MTAIKRNAQQKLSSSSALMGTNFLLAIQLGYGFIPFSTMTTQDLSLSAETIEVTNKSSGAWKSSMKGMKNWSISGAAHAYNNVEDAMDLEKIWEVFNSSESYQVQVIPINWEGESFDIDYSSLPYWQGNAILTSSSLSLGLNESVSFDIQMEGVGELYFVKSQPVIDTLSVSLLADREVQAIINFDKATEQDKMYEIIISHVDEQKVLNLSGTLLSGESSLTIQTGKDFTATENGGDNLYVSIQGAAFGETDAVIDII